MTKAYHSGYLFITVVFGVQVKIRYANNTNETFVFHGPNAADERPGPVKLTEPYFDCDRSNKWSVPAITPVGKHPACLKGVVLV